MESSINFDNLPPEMKLFVFSFFKRHELNKHAAKICKKWRVLCQDPIIWKRLSTFGEKRTSEQLCNVFNRNHFVRCAAFFNQDDFQWLNNITKHKSLRCIQLWQCSSLSKITISQLIDKFPNVEILEIEQESNLILDAFFQITQWKSLKSFKLNNFCPNDDLMKYLPSVMEKIENLEEIYIGKWSTVFINNEAFNQLTRVKGLNLKYINLFFSFINSTGFKLMSTTCINLRHLKIGNPWLLNDHDFVMLKNLPSLEILRIEVCNTLFTPQFPSIFKDVTFPRLTEFVVRSCYRFDDVCLKTFIQFCCPKLTDLNICKSSLISDEGLKSIPTIRGNLELLIVDNIENITGGCLESIAKQLPKLCYCVAKRCPMINGGKVHRVVNNPKSRMYLKRNWL